jgi:ParB family chromosome partitioning protein
VAKKQALGRGIGALFSDNNISEDVVKTVTQVKNGEIPNQVKIDLLEANPYQPRKTFDKTALDELASSVRANGIIQPIVVRKKDSKYQIIAGERRFRAAKQAGLDNIPVVVRDIDDQAMMELAIIENLQRENLSAIEEANGIKLFMDQLALTQDQVADRLGKSRTAVTNLLRLLNLPGEIQLMVNDGTLTMGHARALLSLDSEEQILSVAKQIVNDGLSVRQTESLVKNSSAHSAVKPNVHAADKSASVLAVENLLEDKFGTRVRLDAKKIMIDYNGNTDLNRILDILDIRLD